MSMPHAIDLAVEDARWETAIPDLEARVTRAVEAGLAIAPDRQPVQPAVPTPLGDVVLAYETLVRESAEQSKPLQNHLAHLLVHGILHCLGQDHEIGEAEADAMEALEVAALATLGIPDPYA